MPHSVISRRWRLKRVGMMAARLLWLWRQTPRPMNRLKKQVYRAAEKIRIYPTSKVELSCIFSWVGLAKSPFLREKIGMNKSRTLQPMYLSKLTGLSARLSVVLMFSSLLVGCGGDDKAPTVEWFVDNPSEIYRTLRRCDHPTKYNPMPHYTRCTNARSAFYTTSMSQRKLEEEKNLAAARDTPEDLKTIEWYEYNRHALIAKVKACKENTGKVTVEFHVGCLKANRAAMNRYVRGQFW